jgi:hypothetical protein
MGNNELYPGFFSYLHSLITTQIEYTKLRILLMKIVIAILIVFIIANILACVFSIVLPLFGMSIIGWLLKFFSPGFVTDGGM